MIKKLTALLTAIAMLLPSAGALPVWADADSDVELTISNTTGPTLWSDSFDSYTNSVNHSDAYTVGQVLVDGSYGTMNKYTGIDGITLITTNRTDDSSYFKITDDENGGKALTTTVSRFSNADRGAQIVFNETYVPTADNDLILAFKVKVENLGETTFDEAIQLNGDNTQAINFVDDLGIELGTWEDVKVVIATSGTSVYVGNSTTAAKTLTATSLSSIKFNGLVDGVSDYIAQKAGTSHPLGYPTISFDDMIVYMGIEGAYVRGTATYNETDNTAAITVSYGNVTKLKAFQVNIPVDEDIFEAPSLDEYGEVADIKMSNVWSSVAGLSTYVNGVVKYAYVAQNAKGYVTAESADVFTLTLKLKEGATTPYEGLEIALTNIVFTDSTADGDVTHNEIAENVTILNAIFKKPGSPTPIPTATAEPTAEPTALPTATPTAKPAQYVEAVGKVVDGKLSVDVVYNGLGSIASAELALPLDETIFDVTNVEFIKPTAFEAMTTIFDTASGAAKIAWCSTDPVAATGENTLVTITAPVKDSITYPVTLNLEQVMIEDDSYVTYGNKSTVDIEIPVLAAAVTGSAKTPTPIPTATAKPTALPTAAPTATPIPTATVKPTSLPALIQTLWSDSFDSYTNSVDHQTNTEKVGQVLVDGTYVAKNEYAGIGGVTLITTDRADDSSYFNVTDDANGGKALMTTVSRFSSASRGAQIKFAETYAPTADNDLVLAFKVNVANDGGTTFDEAIQLNGDNTQAINFVDDLGIELGTWEDVKVVITTTGTSVYVGDSTTAAKTLTATSLSSIKFNGLVNGVSLDDAQKAAAHPLGYPTISLDDAVVYTTAVGEGATAATPAAETKGEIEITYDVVPAGTAPDGLGLIASDNINDEATERLVFINTTEADSTYTGLDTVTLSCGTDTSTHAETKWSVVNNTKTNPALGTDKYLEAVSSVKSAANRGPKMTFKKGEILERETVVAQFATRLHASETSPAEVIFSGDLVASADKGNLASPLALITTDATANSAVYAVNNALEKGGANVIEVPNNKWVLVTIEAYRSEGNTASAKISVTVDDETTYIFGDENTPAEMKDSTKSGINTLPYVSFRSGNSVDYYGESSGSDTVNDIDNIAVYSSLADAQPTAPLTAAPTVTPLPTATAKTTAPPTAIPTVTSTPTPIPHSGTDGTITWTVSDGILTIEGAGEIPDYEQGGAPWYALASEITGISIVNGINTIGANAFYGLNKALTVTVPESVRAIGNGAFYDCSSLAAFEIPSGVLSIGDNTFRGCAGAVTIKVPDTVTSIGEAAFDGCKKLTEVNIPDGVKYIENYTFRNCSSLKNIVIPNNVETIGESVFAGCTKLHTMKIPFVGANNAPGSTTVTDKGVFGYFFGCDNKDIPASVTKVEITGTDLGNYIPMEAFKDCAYIEDIIIDGGGSVLSGAFVNCKNLKNLYIPKSISTIGSKILEGCTQIQTLTVPFIGTNRRDQNSENSVLGGFFGYDDSDITGTVQYYNNDESYHYYKIPRTLKNVSVLNQTTIPAGAFSECDFLEKVAIITASTMNSYAFYRCASLKSITLPYDLQTIGSQAFAECENLETINIPTKVKTIGSQAFYNCRSLENVTMPDSITEIADDVFNGTNLYSEVNLLANRGTITCSSGSDAYNYATEHGIATNVVSPEELNVQKTSTSVALLSDNSYLFDITDSYNMNGTLHVELYGEADNMISEVTREANDVEYRIEFAENEMTDVSYAKIYITDENGNDVTTEAELLSAGGGDIPEIPETDIEMSYSDGTVTFEGTTVKSGTVLIQAIYNSDNSLKALDIYPVTSTDPIDVSTEFETGHMKLMLWESLEGMKPITNAITR